jgi:uncharacterized protein YceK
MKLSLKIQMICLLVFVVFSGGCASLIGTLMSDGTMNGNSKIYIGVRIDAAIIDGDGGPYFKGGGSVLLSMIDFPLSFVFDTLFLPVTVPTYLNESYRKNLIESEMKKARENPKNGNPDDKTSREPQTQESLALDPPVNGLPAVFE